MKTRIRALGRISQYCWLGILLAQAWCFQASGQTVIIDAGIDTTLAEIGLNGPDSPHGEAFTNPDGVERWEFDGEDGGGVNQGLLWMAIPDDVLSTFAGTATLALHVDNNGNAANMHRMTVDWLSGPDGGNEVTWNNIPGGPGIVPGDNAIDVTATVFPDSIGRGGEVLFVDVTADVAAWAAGEPNYGWGFIPIAGDGTGITAFENLDNPVPTLTLINQAGGLFPSERLAGPDPTAGNWSVIDYYGDFTANQPAANVVQQVLQIQQGDIQAQAATAQLPRLDITDPDTNVDGGPSLTGAPLPYPANDLTATAPDDDNIISVAHGRIRVQEPGTYTFNVHSDDGFAMRIFSAEFESVGGNGSLDVRSADTILHAGNTGDSNTQAVIQLEAKDYDVEFVSWEQAGGAYYELSAAKGDFVNPVDGKQPQWLAVGDPSELPEQTVMFEAEGVGALTKPLEIYNIDFAATDGLEFAREELLVAIADGTTTASSNDGEIFVIEDDRIVADGCPFDVFPHGGDVVQFPNTAGDLNNFATAIFGAFVVDDGDDTQGEKLTISVHVDSDDRAMFRVIGESFTDIDAQELWDIEGDEVMFGDVDTCNTNFTGLIELTEGVEYDFEAIHVENGGDAGMQVLFAEGDLLFDPDPDAFSPLVLPGGGGTVLARNVGFQLVQGGGALTLPGDFNSDGVLDAQDIDDLTAQVSTGTNAAAYDLNADAKVDATDIGVWVEDLFKSWIGDANLDGEFNSGDLVVVLASGAYEADTTSVWSTGDFNGDGRTTSGDLVAALAGGGYEQGPRAAALAAVPEPTSILSVLLGLLGLVTARRRAR